MTQRMIPEPDSDPEEEPRTPEPGCPHPAVLISVDDFYDLLMEQQEQM